MSAVELFSGYLFQVPSQEQMTGQRNPFTFAMLNLAQN